MKKIKRRGKQPAQGAGGLSKDKETAKPGTLGRAYFRKHLKEAGETAKDSNRRGGKV